MKPKKKKDYLYLFAALLVFLPGCEADGARLMDSLVWLGNHPGLLKVILVVAIVPGVAMIPVVGVPLSLVIAKVGVAMMPLIVELSNAIEDDQRKDRSVGESAGKIVGELADNHKSIVGKVPGAGVVAGVVASAVVRNHRRRLGRAGRAAFRTR